MTVPGNNLLSTALALLFIVSLCYATGRLHQWLKHGLERDAAFRDGYNQATTNLFTLATRIRRRHEHAEPHDGEATIHDLTAARHRQEDREAVTQRLGPSPARKTA